MSDPNKFINTYVDVTVGTVHELLNQVLQLKTEARVTNDLVSERDQVIAALEAEKEQISNVLQEISNQNNNASHELNTARENAARWENEVNHLKNNVTNMDVLTNQYNQLKIAIIDRDKENTALKAENEELKEKVKELSKYEKIAKKEEKKSAVSPVAVPKKDINKEIFTEKPTPLSMPASKPAIVTNKVEETDDF